MFSPCVTQLFDLNAHRSQQKYRHVHGRRSPFSQLKYARCFPAAAHLSLIVSRSPSEERYANVTLTHWQPDLLRLPM
jgi:hypothetical protein